MSVRELWKHEVTAPARTEEWCVSGHGMFIHDKTMKEALEEYQKYARHFGVPIVPQEIAEYVFIKGNRRRCKYWKPQLTRWAGPIPGPPPKLDEKEP